MMMDADGGGGGLGRREGEVLSRRRLRDRDVHGPRWIEGRRRADEPPLVLDTERCGHRRNELPAAHRKNARAWHR